MMEYAGDAGFDTEKKQAKLQKHDACHPCLCNSEKSRENTLPDLTLFALSPIYEEEEEEKEEENKNTIYEDREDEKTKSKQDEFEFEEKCPEEVNALVNLNMFAISPISEEGESDFYEEGTQDEDDEDDLKSLHEMVNFRISEILPSGMKPLDNLGNHSENNELKKGKQQSEGHPQTKNITAIASHATAQILKQDTEAKASQSILDLTEAALKDQNQLSVYHICDWISVYNGEEVSCGDSCSAGSTATHQQRLRRKMAVASVLNCYPQFCKTSQENNDDLWMLTRTEGGNTIEKSSSTKIALNSHTNHWKKQKLAEYRSMSTDAGQSPECIRTKPPQQDEPLNLAMKPQEEPLNLVIRGTDTSVVSEDLSHPKETTIDKCEKREGIRKVFSKISSKSGLAQWTLKKKKCKLKQKQQIPNLKEKLKRNRMKTKYKKVGKSQTVGNKTNRFCPRESPESRKPKDTKIKLIKVGNSYKVAPKKQQPEETDEINENTLVIDEDASAEEFEQIPNEEKKVDIGNDNKADQNAKTDSGCGTSTDNPPRQHVQMVTLTKGKNQERVSIERKPVWIQIPTSSGGAKVIPLVVPNKYGNLQPKSAAQVKQPPRSVSIQHKKSGFPTVTELNKGRKVFKIGGDGIISCLGTLEDVKKSGLMDSNAIPKKSGVEQIVARNESDSSVFIPKKTHANAIKHSTLTSAQKRKAGCDAGVLDLSVKKQSTKRTFTPSNRLTWFVPNSAQFAVKPTPVVHQLPQTPATGTSAIVSCASSHPETFSVPNTTSFVCARKGLLVPVEQNLPILPNPDADQKKESKVQKEENIKTENVENVVNGSFTKSGSRKKIRRELKNKIKESYYDTNKLTGTMATLPVPVSNIRPNCHFQAFSPMYSNPMNQFSNTSVSVSPVFYPGQWPTRPPYQVPRPCFNSTRTFPYSHQQMTSNNSSSRFVPNRHHLKPAPSHTYVPSRDSRTEGEMKHTSRDAENTRDKPLVNIPHLRV